MKSLIVNNGSVLRQMDQRKRRRTRKRALITIKQRKKQMLGVRQMQARGSDMSPAAHIQDALILKVTPAVPQAAAVALWNGRCSIIDAAWWRSSRLSNHSASDRMFVGCSSGCMQRLMLKIMIHHLFKTCLNTGCWTTTKT